MKTYCVRNPFYSRVGQFGEGKQTLCIGLDIQALGSAKTFRCYIGKNRKVFYEIDSFEALRFAAEHNSGWTNPKGRDVAILPLDNFKKGGE